MKSHILVGMALALAILALVSVSPEVVQAGDPAQPEVLGLETNEAGGGDGATGNGPGSVESLNGDPEDWLGGQNVRPIPPKPDSDDDPPSSVVDQFEQLWRTLIRSLEELAR